MPSKIVEIRRTNHNVPVWEEGNHEMAEYYGPTVQGINVRHESKTNPVPYTGLDIPTLKLLLPLVTDIEENGKEFFEFNKKKKEFYNRLIAYPSFAGLKLEVGLKSDNEKPVSEDNLPMNLMDYIKFKALFEDDSRVAKTKEDGMAHTQYQFYIVDENREEEAEQKFLAIKEDAMTNYLTIKDSLKEVRKYIILMEEGTQLASDEKDLAKLKVRLNKLIEQDPKKFYNLFNDKDNTPLFIVQQLLNYGVLEVRPGGAYYDKDSTKQIASNKSEMIKWVKDAANTEALNQMKRRLEEKSKAPL